MPKEDPCKENAVWNSFCEKEIQFYLKNSGIKQQPLNGYRIPMDGELVSVSGIQRRPELNGAIGRVVGTDMDPQGRVSVRLVDEVAHFTGAPKSSRLMKVRAERLVPLAVEPLVPRDPPYRLPPPRRNRSDPALCGSATECSSAVSLATTRRLGSAIGSSARGMLSRRG
mmetsp:Transcript_72190/g.200228  ORF Transcript_72190/g.200228 Transcript_72190/m.200228 type:complete len:169 (+) Transcript_72190:151-657(+)